MFRIAGLYFFTPMFRVWLRHSARSMQWAVVVVALALSAGDSIMSAITHNEATIFFRFVPFVGYYLLGYMLRDTVVSNRGLRWMWLGFLSTYLFLMFGTGLTAKLFPHPSTLLARPPSLEKPPYDFLSP